jgi:tRNA(Arg) A34 adenosine deaminase TadA
VLVRDGAIVAEATDAVFGRSDPTAHAERVVVSDYCTAQSLLPASCVAVRFTGPSWTALYMRFPRLGSTS